MLLNRNPLDAFEKGASALVRLFAVAVAVTLSIAIGCSGNLRGSDGGIDAGAQDGGDSSDAGCGLGCSDCTREAFINIGTHPNIAGCSGGFSIAGVATALSMAPQCNRNAGNSSATNPNGTGCSVEDLCAAGWHVCSSSAEVAMRSGTALCDLNFSPQGFWATRQTADVQGPFTCVMGGHDNIVGCGSPNIGGLGTTPPNCTPLDTVMWYQMCQNFPPWACGSAGSTTEADLVTKTGADRGGVICCKT